MVHLNRTGRRLSCPTFRLGLGIVSALLGASAGAYQADGASKPAVDVRAFGAKGDGSTDDSIALQAAVDACPAGGWVLVPKGRWLVRANAVKLRSEVTLKGVGSASIIVKGRELDCAVLATDAVNVGIESLKLRVESTTPALEVGGLAHFHHCTHVTLDKCLLDGTADKGLPSQFSLCQFECCNDVKCLDNEFLNAAGSATGVTGASGEPNWGRGSEFARNVIVDYCDTGIGLWTGARDAHVHDNRLLGRAEKFTSYPVGIDVDGGTNSVIENNDIAGGHIAIRIYDTHNGVYPIDALMVRNNYLHDQRSYDNVHPAWAIKPENPKSRIDATFVKNRIVESAPNAVGFMGGGAGHTVLHVDDNQISGATFWSFGYYKEGALEIISDGSKIDWKSTVGKNKVANGT